MALFLIVDAAQATGRGVAERTLRRAVSSLTEVESLAPSVARQPRASSPTQVVDEADPLSVADFAVQVAITAEEAAALDPAELSRTLAERSAAAIYKNGTSVLRAEGDSGDTRPFSEAGLIDRGMNSLREGNHSSLRIAAWALAAVCAALAGGIAVLAKGYGRLTLIGAGVSAAAVLLLALSIGVSLFLRVAAGGTDDYIRSELLRLGQDVSRVPIRNGIAFAALGLGLLSLGLLGTWLDGRLQKPSSLTGRGLDS